MNDDPYPDPDFCMECRKDQNRPDCDIDFYQQLCNKTALYPKENGLSYVALGLAGEAGEIANKVKKIIRDYAGYVSPEKRDDILDEIGDLMWYCAQLATELDADLGTIASNNIYKLAKRKQRGTLQGDGDKR